MQVRVTNICLSVLVWDQRSSSFTLALRAALAIHLIPVPDFPAQLDPTLPILAQQSEGVNIGQTTPLPFAV